MLYTTVALLTITSAKVDFPGALSANSTCIPDGQCYAGNDPEKDCCCGHVIDDPLHCTEGLSCSACTSAVEWVVNELNNDDCSAIAPEAKTACTSLGVPSMFEGLCERIITGSCNGIKTLIAQGLTDSNSICTKPD